MSYTIRFKYLEEINGINSDFKPSTDQKELYDQFVKELKMD